MDPLQATIQRCNLQIKLDEKTQGYGNCFPNAILQQCRRPEIRTWLQNHKPRVIVHHHLTLRKRVTNFALKSRHPTIIDFKTKYDQILQQDNQKSWTEYWNEMAQGGTWADYLFVQVCAWYLELDMLILTTSSTPTNPFIFISGNFNNLPASISGPPLLLGNYTNVHYQSLLPVNENQNIKKTQKPACVIVMTKSMENDKEVVSKSSDNISSNTIKPHQTIINRESQPKSLEEKHREIITNQNTFNIASRPDLKEGELPVKKFPTEFEYQNEGKVIVFPTTEENEILCHCCKKVCKRIISHLQNRAECRANINMVEFKQQITEFKRPATLQNHNLRNKTCKDKKRAKLGQDAYFRYATLVPVQVVLISPWSNLSSSP